MAHIRAIMLGTLEVLEPLFIENHRCLKLGRRGAQMPLAQVTVLLRLRFGLWEGPLVRKPAGIQGLYRD